MRMKKASIYPLIVMLLTCLFFSCFFGRKIYLAKQSSNWPTVIGFVKDASISIGGKENDEYSLHVYYRYVLDGTNYDGKQRLDYYSMDGAKSAQSSTYKHHREIKVYYSPGDSTNSRIAPGLGNLAGMTYFAFGFMVLLSIFFIWLLPWYELKKKDESLMGQFELFQTRSDKLMNAIAIDSRWDENDENLYQVLGHTFYGYCFGFGREICIVDVPTIKEVVIQHLLSLGTDETQTRNLIESANKRLQSGENESLESQYLGIGHSHFATEDFNELIESIFSDTLENDNIS